MGEYIKIIETQDDKVEQIVFNKDEATLTEELLPNNVNYRLEFEKNNQSDGIYFDGFATIDQSTAKRKAINSYNFIENQDEYTILTFDYHVTRQLNAVDFFTIDKPYDRDLYIQGKQKVYFLESIEKKDNFETNEILKDPLYRNFALNDEVDQLMVHELSFTDIEQMTSNYVNSVLIPTTEPISLANTTITNHFDDEQFNNIVSAFMVEYDTTAEKIGVIVNDKSISLFKYLTTTPFTPKDVFNTDNLIDPLKCITKTLQIFRINKTWQGYRIIDVNYNNHERNVYLVLSDGYTTKLIVLNVADAYHLENFDIMSNILTNKKINFDLRAFNDYAKIIYGSYEKLIFKDSKNEVHWYEPATVSTNFDEIAYSTRALIDGNQWNLVDTIIRLNDTEVGLIYKSSATEYSYYKDLLVPIDTTKDFILPTVPNSTFTNAHNQLFTFRNEVYSFEKTDGVDPLTNVKTEKITIDLATVTTNRAETLMDFTYKFKTNLTGLVIQVDKSSMIAMSNGLTFELSKDTKTTMSSIIQDITPSLIIPVQTDRQDSDLFFAWCDSRMVPPAYWIKAVNNSDGTIKGILDNIKAVNYNSDLLSIDELLYNLITLNLADKNRNSLPTNANGTIDQRYYIGFVQEIPGTLGPTKTMIAGHNANMVLQTGVRKYSDLLIENWVYKNGLNNSSIEYIILRNFIALLSGYINCSYSYGSDLQTFNKVYLPFFLELDDESKLFLQNDLTASTVTLTQIPKGNDINIQGSSSNMTEATYGLFVPYVNNTDNKVSRLVTDIKFKLKTEYPKDVYLSEYKTIRTDRVNLIKEPTDHLIEGAIPTIPSEVKVDDSEKQILSNYYVIPDNIFDKLYMSEPEVVSPKNNIVQLRNIPLVNEPNVYKLGATEYQKIDLAKAGDKDKDVGDVELNKVKQLVDKEIKARYGNVPYTIDWDAMRPKLRDRFIEINREKFTLDTTGAGSRGGNNIYTFNYWGQTKNAPFWRRARFLIASERLTNLNPKWWGQASLDNLPNNSKFNMKTSEVSYFVLAAMFLKHVDVSTAYWNYAMDKLVHVTDNDSKNDYIKAADWGIGHIRDNYFKSFVSISPNTNAFIEQHDHGVEPITYTGDDWSIYVSGEIQYIVYGQFLDFIEVTIDVPFYNYDASDRQLMFSTTNWTTFKSSVLNAPQGKKSIIVYPENERENFKIISFMLKTVNLSEVTIKSDNGSINIPTFSKFDKKIVREVYRIVDFGEN